jgi:hypothetical protein
MSGEIKAAASSWTTDTLKEHIEEQVKALRDAIEASQRLNNERHTASEKAITKAEDAQKSYNATHNDLTRKMEAQTKDFVSRFEMTSMLKNIEERFAHVDADIRSLRESRGERRGQDQGNEATIASGRANIAIVVSATSVLVLLWRAITGN